MEQVFWLMWLSDVVGSLGVFGVACLIALAFGMLAIVVVVGVCDEESPLPGMGRAMKIGRWMLVPVAVAIFAPSQKTIQILAVSSAADAAASTKLGQKGLQALDAVLDRVIDGASKK